MHMTRSQFLRLFAGAGAGALGLGALAACDKSEPKTPDAPAGTPDAPKPPVDAAIDAKQIDAPMPAGNCLQNGTSTVIGFNHGHTLTVPKTDVMAGVDKIYDIQGASLHFHKVTVTAAMFVMLQQNTAIQATSDIGDSAHTHPVTVTCA